MQMLQTIKLIDDTYSVQEARERVVALLNHEINTLHLRNLSSEVRFGKPDQHALDHAEKLETEKERLLQLLKKAEAENKSIKINSNMHLNIEHV